MRFPLFNRTEFRRCLYTLWPSSKCTLDRTAAANYLGVSVSTLSRWLAGRQRVPLAVWKHVWLLSSGSLPELLGWAGWQFISRYDVYQQRQIQVLVAPNAVEYTPSDILSWHFKSQLLAHLSTKVKNMDDKPATANPNTCFVERKVSV